jgi:serine/threonine-protein kinase RsbW
MLDHKDMNQITIANDLDQLYDLEATILAQVEYEGYDDNSQFAIRLILDEALTNAYKHGNKADPHKHIHVQYTITREQIEVTIEDEGDGFDLSCLPDPRREETLSKTSGRGIFLIRQFTSSFGYNQTGNTIYFTFRQKPNLEINAHGLSYWRFENAIVLEVDSFRVEQNPVVLLESVLRILDQGAERIILDMNFVDRFDNQILDQILQVGDRLYQEGGKLILIRPSPPLTMAIQERDSEGILILCDSLNQTMNLRSIHS